jgi:hypothetical protein
MIGLHMVDHKIIDLFRLDNLVNIMNQVIPKSILDCVKKGYLIIQNEKGVICGAFVCGISMKVSDIPINGAHPVNAFFHFNDGPQDTPPLSEFLPP